MSPTERTLKWLRDAGWYAHVVEKWIPHTKTRVDAFGFGDILAFRGAETLLVQATSTSNVSARIAKIKASKLAQEWVGIASQGVWLLASGAQIETISGATGFRQLWVIGWRKYKKAENGRYWRETVVQLTPEAWETRP